jgi:bacterioferritin-associated ferredoxin
MIICSCNVLSDGDIRAAIEAEAVPPRTSISQIYRGLGHAPQCGRCASTIREIVNATRQIKLP